MAYQQMASLYDQLMTNAPYDQWLQFTKSIIEKSGKNIKTIVDLGCGTGEITIGLAKAGYNLTGVDFSSDMLTYAEQKASNEKQSIQWINQDLRELTGFTNLDVAVSYCDVINYITSENELATVFTRVAESLKVGGLFIFDVHSLQHVEHRLVNQVFTLVTDDISYIWDCSEGEEFGEMHHDLTFFASDGHGKYDRFEEFHHQRTHSVEIYTRLLIEAGFEKPVLYSDFSLESDYLSEKSERIFFVAQKRSR